MAGRQTAEELSFKKKKQEEDSTDPQLAKSKQQNEEAARSQADEELEVSETSAVCLPQEKTLNKVSFVPIFRLAQKHSAKTEGGRKGWKRMRARALEKRGRPTEGTRWGHWCLFECEVSLWCLTQCAVHAED